MSVAALLVLALCVQTVFLNKTKKSVFDLIPLHRIGNFGNRFEGNKILEIRYKIRKTLRNLWKYANVNWSDKKGNYFTHQHLKQTK